MNIPKTYEEFLHMPKEELNALRQVSLSDEDFTRMISFCRHFEEEMDKNNLIHENNEEKYNTLYEELYGKK